MCFLKPKRLFPSFPWLVDFYPWHFYIYLHSKCTAVGHGTADLLSRVMQTSEQSVLNEGFDSVTELILHTSLLNSRRLPLLFIREITSLVIDIIIKSIHC